MSGVSGLGKDILRLDKLSYCSEKVSRKKPSYGNTEQSRCGEGTLNMAGLVGWYKEDILQSMLNPEICLASS